MKLVAIVLSITSLGLVVLVLQMRSENAALEEQLLNAKKMRSDSLNRIAEERKDCQVKKSQLERELFIENRARKKFEAALRRSSDECPEEGRSHRGNEVLVQLRDEQVEKSVDQKYAILLELLDVSQVDRERLKAFLVERQRIIDSPTTSYFSRSDDVTMLIEQQQLLLADLDHKVETLLGPDNFQLFEQMKDSDLEQHQLRKFNQSLDSSLALSAEQRKAVLLQKLKLKQQYTASLEQVQIAIDMGAYNDAIEMIDVAVDTYQKSYFSGAREHLNEKQYAALVALEKNLFNQMRKSLLTSLNLSSQVVNDFKR